MNESGWLIERRPAVASSPQYLIVQGHNADSPVTVGGSFAWSTSHHFALRFARRSDAILFVGALRDLANALPHLLTLPGLRSGDEAPVICEHAWVIGRPEDADKEAP